MKATHGPVGEEVLARLVLRPDHRYTSQGNSQPARPSERQLAAALRELLADLGISVTEIPRRLHTERETGQSFDCACLPGAHRPSQEVYREQARDLFRWASAPIPESLQGPGIDVPREGDETRVLQAVIAGDWTKFQSWQRVTRKYRELFGESINVTRYWRAVDVLVEKGVLVHCDISVRTAGQTSSPEFSRR